MAIHLKTKEEINILKEGGKRHAQILRELKKATKAGISSLEIDNLANELIEKHEGKAAFLGYTPDGAKTPYPASVCISINEEVVHGIPKNDRIFKEGDLVTLDLGFVYKGMITDSAISFVVGKKKNKEYENLIACHELALENAIKKAVVGGHIGDISFEIEKVAKENGFGIIKGLSGHGVGYAVHEDPYVPNEGRAGDGEIIKEGLVIAIEPMFSLGKGHAKLLSDGYTYSTRDGSISAHVEHTIAVTKDGPVILTE